jgi:hypothetical protein
MVRAPGQIPPSGAVECTDSTEVPTAALAIALVSAGVVAYGLSDLDRAINSGGALLPVLGLVGVQASFAAAEGYAVASDCRAAKRQGAEIVRRRETRSDGREQAVAAWKRAAVAARAGDCATVRELEAQTRELDVEFHAVMFRRDVAIVRCLPSAE